MQALLDTLIANGYLVVFFWVLVAQLGVPLPAVPLLLAAGAVAGTGQLGLVTIAALSLLASLAGDSLWFVLGRRQGNRVLALLCRMSLEPDSCVRRTRSSFGRNQTLTVVFAKFVPGLSTMAPPLAGMLGMSWRRFLWLDGLGAVVWSLAFLLPGYALSDRLEQVAEQAALTGTWLLGLLVTCTALVVVIKVVRRQLFLRALRMARIHPDELSAQLDAEAPLFIVDLRHAHDFAADARVIPGALRFDAEELEQRHAAIPRDRDVVLYCT